VKVEVGDVVSVVTTAGEFVGKLDGFDGDAVVLVKPRMLVMGENGGMGFARGICMTGVENPESATFHSVVFITPCNEQIADAWVEATTGIALAR
jgi:hypothetical protein